MAIILRFQDPLAIMAGSEWRPYKLHVLEMAPTQSRKRQASSSHCLGHPYSVQYCIYLMDDLEADTQLLIFFAAH